MRPQSRKGVNEDLYGHLGATIVDSMDTLLMMGLRKGKHAQSRPPSLDRRSALLRCCPLLLSASAYDGAEKRCARAGRSSAARSHLGPPSFLPPTPLSVFPRARTPATEKSNPPAVINSKQKCASWRCAKRKCAKKKMRRVSSGARLGGIQSGLWPKLGQRVGVRGAIETQKRRKKRRKKSEYWPKE